MITDLNSLPEINESLDFDPSLFTIVGAQDEKSEQITTAPYSYWRSVLRQLFKNKVAIFCLLILVVIIIFTIFGPMMGSSNKISREPGMYGRPTSVAPSSEHWFGTSIGSGKDLWNQIWLGCQFSLRLAVVVSLINVAIGLIVGGIWGYVRAIDPIMIEISNVISNIPSLLIYIMIMKLLPLAGDNSTIAFWEAVLVMSLFGWMGLASTLRTQIIIIRNREFNIASVALGSKASTIIIHNLLPSLVSIIAQVVIDYIPATISSEVSLIYFGVFGGELPSLGQVLNTSYQSKNIADALNLYPHTLFFPALIMMLLTISFFYFGMAVADATDPKRHR